MDEAKYGNKVQLLTRLHCAPGVVPKEMHSPIIQAIIGELSLADVKELVGKFIEEDFSPDLEMHIWIQGSCPSMKHTQLVQSLAGMDP